MEELRNSGHLLFESIRGSKLHGLDTEKSDTDTTGIFIAPLQTFLGFEDTWKKTIQSPGNDDTWDEIGKVFMELRKSNPNTLEALFTPSNLILHYNPILDPLFELRDELITKECFGTFGHYALDQMKKAKNLNKAINTNPQEVKERKTPLHFCNVIEGNKSIPLYHWLKERGLEERYCGLVRLPRGIELYTLYYDWGADKNKFRPWKKRIGYRGILDPGDTKTSQLRLSSIPGKEKPLCSFQFNVNAYTDHCKKYKQYWDWVEHRNPERYKLDSGYDFNAKNLSNVVRLLTMAKEIAEGKGIILDRRNIDREFLLGISEHKYTYEEVMKYVEEVRINMLESFKTSKLPEKPDRKKLEDVLVKIRTGFYF